MSTTTIFALPSWLTPRRSLVAGIALIAVPVALLAVGLWLGAVGNTAYSAGVGSVSTSGTVVALQQNGDVCSPIASFTVDGAAYTATSRAALSPCSAAVGDTVSVSYLPDSIASSALVAPGTVFGDLVRGLAIAVTVLLALIGALILLDRSGVLAKLLRR